jgi:hypothetical protein
MHWKKLSLYGAFASLVPASAAVGQPCPPTAPPTQVVTGYAVTTPPSSFVTIAGMPGTVTVFTGTVDDSVTNPAPMPFTFFTFDGPATTYQIGANGFVDFNQSYFPGFFFAHPNLPDPGQPNGWATPWYDDLLHTTTAPVSNTYMLLTGAPGSQKLIVEWNSLRQFPNPGACVPNGTERVTTQIVLNQSGSVIEFKYNNATFNPGLNCWAALIGVENLAGNQGVDPSGLGPFNAAPPATDYVLTPTLGPGPPPMVLPTYFVSPIPPGFTSIAGNPGATVELINCADDTNSLTIPLPFSFDFYTVPEFVVILNANGFLTFDNLWSGTGFTNNLGGPGLPNRLAAPFWDDLLHADPASQTAWLVTGTAPNRQFIAEWTDVATWEAGGCLDTGTRFTFQAVLKEGSNDIEYRYDLASQIPVGSTLATASIGAEDSSGTNFVDATGLGGANQMLPATNLRLDPCELCGNIAPFGAGCPTGGATIPVIGTSGGAPTPGNAAFAVTQTSGTPNASAMLIIGLSKNAWGLIPLPANLAFLLNPACTLNVSVDALVNVTTSPAGAVTIPIPIPGAVASCSAQVFFQWADIDFSLLPGGFLAMSRGLWVTLG